MGEGGFPWLRLVGTLPKWADGARRSRSSAVGRRLCQAEIWTEGVGLRRRVHKPAPAAARSRAAPIGSQGLITSTRLLKTSSFVAASVRPGYVMCAVTVTMPTGHAGFPLTVVARDLPAGSSDGSRRSCRREPPGDDVVSFSPQKRTAA